MVASGKKTLLQWYAQTHPHTVDLVGDIAGREPFLVHGESLIRYCIEESGVNFQDGFQVLHAVYAVERFLNGLQKRGCDFDVVFFRNLRDLCVPTGSETENQHKHQLTRKVLLLHLARHSRECAKSGARASVREFDSPESQEFLDYLQRLPIHFILCHEGDDHDADGTIQLRHMIYKFISSSKNVAIINSIQWKSSKVFAPLLSRSYGGLPPIVIGADFDSPYIPLYTPDDAVLHSSVIEALGLSIRERVGILASRSILERKSAEDSPVDAKLEESVQAFLLHLAVLKNCTLLERQRWVASEYNHDHSEDSIFLRQVTEASLALLESEDLIGANSDKADWDLYDPVDGFLFAAMLKKLRKRECIPPQAIGSWKSLWSALRSGVKRRLQEDLPLVDKPTDHEEPPTSLSAPGPSALPFSHPVLDEFLNGIELEERQDSQDAVSGLVFEDLHHWHNTKLLISHKKPEKLGFFARKRKQERTRDIVAYSTSLTNARGKIIEPETVVVKKAHGAKNKAAGANHKEPNSKAKKGNTKSNNKKGGREDALKTAQKVQEQKALEKRDKIVGFWDKTCREIENDHSLVSRYLKTIKFLLDRPQDDIRTIGSEVYLYLSHILGQLWAKSRDKVGKDSRAGLYLIAMIWKWLQQISAAGASKAVVQTVEKLTTYLQMPTLPIVLESHTRELGFKFDYKALKSVGNVVKDCRALQLEHAGPYLERRFDSQPDDRVPFDPDAWQRKVLDSIDSDNSLLVIAPTSAGKTFISFYAMKKVLEESDDGVLVYVAPTKALVNQIAAEIGARFNKSYHKQEGKSVWAIYTRDYRVQNPTGCQVLVTVPHILQIMLLAPTNAKGPNAWSRRIKRIIFDEVHCIGQAEDGVVWEQLLLLAPCPIIALSATVGNPEAFRDWLSLVQKRKGQKLDMVVHTARYSDLRKFVYRPKARLFEGLKNEKAIPVPGLDEGDSFCPDFQFVHPVAALTDRNRTALDDLSLEARDCLSLWTSMKKVLSSEDMVKFEVPEPSTALPEAIAKSDVLQWETKLKRALRQIMETQSSTFQDIRKTLEPPPANNELLEDTLAEQADNLFNLASDLHGQDALPALVFHYDSYGCEHVVQTMSQKLKSAEDEWKEESSEWARKMKAFEAWKRTKERQPKVSSTHRGKDAAKDDSATSKQALMQEKASDEASPWESFDPDAPLSQFSFADMAKAGDLEVQQDFIAPLKDLVDPWLLAALRRGLGVHHAGMNRQYRQAVEIMFRRGYLRLVVATGTLALGINMPCKTVVFHCDSIFLTAQNYRQASGRAGRRGFDLLGNVVFSGIPDDRVYEIMSARLPDLNGQFPISTTLVLRLLSLLHGTENCSFASGMVQSLLSQTRLYLGGPESEMSVKHHLRFSIEYLRRQHLLSEKGAPINFSGLVGHLYFTENAIFAFHSLLKGGYFHRLCSRIDKNPEGVLLEMMLVLCHLFNRIPVRRHQKVAQIAHKSSSLIFLPRLPPKAEKLLVGHNRETLAIFKGYVQSYISHNLSDKQDRTLPFTKTAVGQEKASSGEATANMVRSPFVALSGFTDDFESIHELCETVRGDVFLEESAIPFIPVWPHDTDVELNSYVYDFYKHGSLHVLTRDNGIRRGDVWFFLQDFSRTLSTIVASLTTLIRANEMADSEDLVEGEDDGEKAPDEQGASRVSQGPRKASSKVVDDWAASGDDEDGDEGDAKGDAEADGSGGEPSSVVSDWDSNSDDDETMAVGGLHKVLGAFTKLRDEFDEKFRKTWA